MNTLAEQPPAYGWQSQVSRSTSLCWNCSGHSHEVFRSFSTVITMGTSTPKYPPLKSLHIPIWNYLVGGNRRPTLLALHIPILRKTSPLACFILPVRRQQRMAITYCWKGRSLPISMVSRLCGHLNDTSISLVGSILILQ